MWISSKCNRPTRLLEILKKLARDKIVYLCTGSQGEPMGALNRISNFTHPDVFIEKDDTVIFSSKIIPGNVRKHYNVHNKLLKDGS